MRARSPLLPILLLLAAVMPVAPLLSQAQAPAPAPAFAPTDPLPFDPSVTKGTLANGVQYFIRRNGKPEKRVLMQLAVKAGSIDEADDQQGLAHFLEHMAFNGTTHFKPGELIATLESSGARMGPHVNASTSFDETIYMFQLPTDKEGVVEKGMQALSDFAGGMTLDPKEIDKERGVVIEEWRGGLGAGARLRDQQIPVLYYQSKYARAVTDRQARDPEVVHAGPSQGLLHEVVSPGSHGGCRGRRPGSREDGSARPLSVRGDCEALHSRTGATLPRAAARRAASEGGQRFRGHTVVGVAGAQARGRHADARCRLPREPRPSARLSDDERSLRRDVAQAGRTVPQRRSIRQHPVPFGCDFFAQRQRPGRQDRRGPGGARDRSQARQGARLRRRRAGSHEEVDTRRLRTRLLGARQEREQLLRAGVHRLLPRERAEPGDRGRVPAGKGHDSGDRRRRRQRRGEVAVRLGISGDPGDLAAEAEPRAADRRGAPRDRRSHRSRGGHGVERRGKRPGR